ncbi:MAG: aconitate hydratase [Mycobacterium sp.]|nr:aconitate hydratase [Mycobacterium sp.]
MSSAESVNSFSARDTLKVGDKTYQIYRLAAVDGTDKLPYSLKVLAENLLRTEDGSNITADHIRAIAQWDPNADPSVEIQFTPARVIMQDFTGVPCIVDLATMREAVGDLGGDPGKVNPLSPADLVIDHSVIADLFGRADAFERNVEIEYQRNGERYQFLRWGQGAFDDFKVVPPGTGIVHQVNIEYLASVVMDRDGEAYPDTCVGTDSHTTMVNGLGVLGWGVGGIEAEAAMLGQPVSMLIPRVVGFKLTGEIQPGVTATDVVLTVTEMLRKHGVVGKFVEFYGAGVAEVPLANRATLGNMSPEFGSTAAIFPIDQVTIDYMRFTGRDDEHLALVEAYAKAQGLWHTADGVEPVYSEYATLDLADVEPSLAGPSRPQDRVSLDAAGEKFRTALGRPPRTSAEAPTAAPHHLLTEGDVVVAAITSCTNTSNPQVMVAAGLLAQRAAARGLRSKPWVKTSLAPGSRVVMDYLQRAGLVEPLEQLGFFLVGYGCTTCIGNSGPLLAGVTEAVHADDLSVVSVLSGNRNFEGRIHPDVRMNYLASPPLVVAYALAGTMDIDLTTEPLGQDADAQPVFLADLWPGVQDVSATIQSSLTSDMFRTRYSAVFDGDDYWRQMPVAEGETFSWQDDSTYVKNPPYFDGMTMTPAPVADIEGARVLVMVGDSVTTDHISPAGSIGPDTPAGRYLTEHGVPRGDFNSYGARRGNHEVMMRGTFANVRLRNRLAPGTEGGFTRHFPDGAETSIFDAAMEYAGQGTPLVVLAGLEYGTGSSRDWAAKGTALLGVRAVIAQSYERIHRSNLIGMGVLPLQLYKGDSAESLGLLGTERFSIAGIEVLNDGELPKELTVVATTDEGSTTEFRAIVRIDTPMEAEYYRHGGILPYVLRQLAG